MNRFVKLKKEIIERIKVKEETYLDIREVIEIIIDNLKEELSEYLEEPEKDIYVGGSFPRKTFVVDEFDIDIFIRFPQTMSINQLEKLVFTKAYGLFGIDKVKKRYADHPYAEVFYKGITINLVPAYKTEPPNWISPVDRTYFHTIYLNENLRKEQVEEVLLLKSFLRGIDCYGAEISIKGFSGYLSELIILYYNDFKNLLENVSKWRPPIVIDIEKQYRDQRQLVDMFPRAKLIVVDPVDKTRNVAAGLSNKNLARFISASKAFLNNMRKEFFYPYSEDLKKKILNDVKIEDVISQPLLIILVKHGEKIEDIYHGQLEKLSRKIVKQLDLKKMKVLKSAVYSDYKSLSMMVLYLPRKTLDNYYSRLGPPTYIKSEKDFLEKNKEETTLWIENDGRWHVIQSNKPIQVKRYVEQLLIKNIVKIPSEIQNDKIEVLYVDELEKELLNGRLSWLAKFIKGEDFWRIFY